MTHTILKTPGGEELVVLPLAEFRHMRDALDAVAHARVMADIESGKQELLGEGDVARSLAEPTPLAFWRKKRGLTQKELASVVGVTQQFIAQVEKGRRRGDPALFLGLSRALQVRMEDLVTG